MVRAKASELKKGMKVKIDTYSCSLQGCGFEDKIYVIANTNKITDSTRLCFENNPYGTNGASLNGYNVYARNVYIISYSIEDIKVSIKELQAEIDEKQSIIDYLTETNLADYDETQHKVYKTLKLLNKEGMTDIEKSVLIAKLINQ